MESKLCESWVLIYTVSQEPQCARFRRLFTCSPIFFNPFKTMYVSRFRQLSLNVALRQWRNRTVLYVLNQQVNI